MPTQFFTDGNDTFTVTAAGDYNLVFLDGNDSLTVDGGTFTTGVMGEGADVITLQAGDALIYGDGGNDRFEIFGSGFEARGGADDDSFNIRGGDNLILRGDGGDDRFTFFAGSLAIVLRAGSGDDVINGRNQVISGNIFGEAGNDTFTGFRNAGGTVPNLRGGLGDDIYVAHPTAPANFIENSGEGIDTVQVPGGRNYALPANIENLIAGAFGGAIAGAVTLDGNGQNNLIQGYTNAETVSGFGGNDTLLGGGGDDTLNGGGGNDQLNGQAGADTLVGGVGNDTYYVDGTPDIIVEARGEGTDIVRVLAGGYTLPTNVENGMIDAEFGASLTGNSAANTLTGGNGADFLDGAGGNDRLYGGAGDEFIKRGGDGNDILDSGMGGDLMLGDARNRKEVG
jgi:Ca2+-binding RTX toxin-like protein